MRVALKYENKSEKLEPAVDSSSITNNLLSCDERNSVMQHHQEHGQCCYDNQEWNNADEIMMDMNLIERA